ncbi:hypothetical protein BZM27_54350, partial [Paraburkholderia steynii]
TQDGLVLTGWKAVRITRYIEVATSSFILTCSADANTLKLVSKEGAPVQISIGDSVVLSGYVETIETILTPSLARHHDLRSREGGRSGRLLVPNRPRECERRPARPVQEQREPVFD